MSNQNKKDEKGNTVPQTQGTSSLKEIERKRRQVFKPVLDNPFTQSSIWPFIEPELASNFLDLLCVILSGVGTYNRMIQEAAKTRKGTIPEPEIRKHLTLGFNSTVEALEKQASIHRHRLSKKKHKHTEPTRFIKYVFISKYDITPAILTNHFPVLTFTASSNSEHRVKLIQLPRGSMARLSQALGQENTGIIGFDETTPGAHVLFDMVEKSVSDVDVPWLNGLFDPDDNYFFSKPSLNFLSTSAPILPKKNDQKVKKETAKKVDTNKVSESKKTSKEL